MDAGAIAGGALLVLLGLIFIGMGRRQRVFLAQVVGVAFVVAGVASALGLISLEVTR